MDISKMYFISDTHFGHPSIIKFERKEFHTIQEHDVFLENKLIQWAQVHPKHTLWHLGDFGSIDKLEIFKRLQDEYGCKIGIIKGNHESGQRWKAMKEVFDYSSEYPLYLSNRVIISHQPVYPLPYGMVNICGHLHGAVLNHPQYKVVSLHEINYTPVCGKSISRMVSKTPAPSNDFLYEPYAELYKFTVPKNDVVYDNKGIINLEESRKLFSELHK